MARRITTPKKDKKRPVRRPPDNRSDITKDETRANSNDPYKTLFHAIFHGSLDALLIVDGNTGEILETNRTTRSILGYDHGELINEHFSVLFPADAEESKKAVLENIKVYGTAFVEEFRRRDGSGCIVDLTATMVPWYGESAILVTLRDASERVKAETEREQLIRDLQAAMDKIKTLRGLLPICAHCKKVRDDEGYWRQVEVYVSQHSDVQFSHGICPDCIKKYYSDLDKE